ncbi:hypothetical protein [Saccharomonospora saliphila]|uniref:hypothetical protein n=1 Tax=Saccharomonospora saliphila TaxID=369829 RepID=UPI00037D7DC1|nr:hypothetical protein [Saccharomonospora saliphila]
MEYQLTADLVTPAGTPDLDPLQQVGVVSLLDGRLSALLSIEGPDGVEIIPVEHTLEAHLGGVLVHWLLDAPALAFAEDATRAVLEQTIEEIELLAGWEVKHCAVTATDDQLESALAASAEPGDGIVDGLLGEVDEDGPGMDIPATEASSPGRAHDIAERRARLLRASEHLGAFGWSAFGPDVTEEQARFVAGALLHGIEMLTDELFADIQLLDDEDATAAEVTDLWALDELPPRFADRYTALFAKQFLVATSILGHRLTRSGWTPPISVAEALALHIAECRAEVELDLADVLDAERIAKVFSIFNEYAFADSDFEALFDTGDAEPGPDLAFERWFLPRAHLGEDRAPHPYLADEGGTDG